ncbi:MAG: hypothetical protein KF851_01535 [Pirellulaceae bacterium]|nr:hypothetical protein [Pirellulaceae bacterium]
MNKHQNCNDDGQTNGICDRNQANENRNLQYRNYWHHPNFDDGDVRDLPEDHSYYCNLLGGGVRDG